ncbi:hypothetical protein C8F04DRAFT_1228203, partial [Mycena alexandri]
RDIHRPKDDGLYRRYGAVHQLPLERQARPARYRVQPLERAELRRYRRPRRRRKHPESHPLWIQRQGAVVQLLQHSLAVILLYLLLRTSVSLVPL